VEAASFLGPELKKADPDRYLLTLFAPRPMRPALHALFLFNVELVRTRGAVSNTQLGLIRLQWWREELGKIYDGGDGGQIPVFSTLAPLIHNGTLPREWFEALLYAREFDLEDVAPASWSGLTNYADFTTTPLNQLALRITGENANLAEIRHISTNYGLLDAIRSVPLLLSQHRCILPEDELQKRKLSPQKIMDFNHKAEILEILELKYSFFSPYRKPESWFLRHQQAMTFIYLKWLAKNKFDVFSPKMQTSPPFLGLRVALS
jgi:phytoene/squalene synthetase